MSEPSSFFLHAHITPEKLEQFLNAPSANIADYTDWQTWFNERERMYGDPAALLRELAHCNAGTSNENIYAEHINYDKETQILTMDHIFLSESFDGFLPLSACLRGLEQYITPGTLNNFMIIYPWWWGDASESLSPEVNIYIEFVNNSSQLLTKTREENVAIANAFFSEYGQTLAEELYNKQGYI
jgi:hypothetical protein